MTRGMNLAEASDRPKRYEDLPPETQRVMDRIIRLGFRVWDRIQAEGVQATEQNRKIAS